MTKDEQRRALELLGKSTGLDEITQEAIKEFLATVEKPKIDTPNEATDKVVNKHKEWIDMAVDEIERCAASHVNITADDLSYLTPPSRACMGAAFRKAASLGIIKAVAYCATERHSGHLLRRWELAAAPGS